jgi:hypothetical protein
MGVESILRTNALKSSIERFSQLSARMVCLAFSKKIAQAIAENAKARKTARMNHLEIFFLMRITMINIRLRA